MNRCDGPLRRCVSAEEDGGGKVEFDKVEYKSVISNISHDLTTPITAVKGFMSEGIMDGVAKYAGARWTLPHATILQQSEGDWRPSDQ